MTMDYSDQYDRLGAEAHKLGAFPIGAPAVVWHLGLLFDPEIVDPDAEGADTENLTRGRDRIIASAREILVNVDSRSQECLVAGADYIRPTFFPADGIAPSAAGSEASPSIIQNDNETILTSFDSILAKVSVAVHTDHLTVTFTLDLSKKPPGKDKWPAHFRTFGDQIDDGGDSPAGMIGQPLHAAALPDGEVARSEGDAEGVGDAKETTHSKLLRNLTAYRDLLDSSGDLNSEILARATAARDYLRDGVWEDVSEIFLGGYDITKGSSGVFADFRGVILPFLQEDVIHIGETKKASSSAPDFASMNDRDRVANMKLRLARLLPLMTLGDRDGRRRELVACGMLRGRAVYVSPLGSAQLYGRRIAKPARHMPVYFALMTNDVHRWQIGRLVQRIHSLGTLRLLALRDLSFIRSASLKIRRLGTELDALNRQYDTKRDKPADEREELGIAELAVRELRRKINALNSGLPGGLAYRIYRSRYFAESFKRLVEDLAVIRIEGWQPYDEFVRRRLYAVYDFIDRVGNRLVDLQKRTDAQVNFLTLGRLRGTADLLIGIQNNIFDSHKLQHVVEWIAFGYYGGVVASYAIKSFISAGLIEFRHEHWYVFLKQNPDFIQGVCLILTSTVGYYWFLKRHRDHNAKLKRTSVGDRTQAATEKAIEKASSPSALPELTG